MNVIQTTIPEVLIIEPKVYGDERGLFFESFNQRVFVEKTGVSKRFVQDNHSRSGTFCAACTTRSSSHRENWCVWWWERYSMWRSICAEVRQASVDGLVRCCPPRTSVWSGSPRDLLTVSWCGPHSPSFSTRLQVTMAPEHERCIIWSDPDLAIAWPFEGEPRLAPKDKAGKLLHDAEVFE